MAGEVSIKEVADKLHSKFATQEQMYSELREAVKAQTEEIKGYGKARAETEQKIEKIINDVLETNKAQQKRLDELEAAQKRAAFAAARGERPRTDRSKAFWSVMRKSVDPDHRRITEEESKLLDSAQFEVKDWASGEVKAVSLASDDATGGIVCPPELTDDIVKDIVEISPVRALATVRPTSRRSVFLTRDETTMVAAWVGEAPSTGSTAVAASLKPIEVVAMAMEAVATPSKEDVDDAVVNLEQLFRNSFSEQFGRAEAIAFLTGATPTKPEGIVKNATVRTNRVITTGTSNVLALADLYAAAYGNATYTGLKEDYARAGTWLFRRNTIGKILQFTTGADAPSFLWQPSLGPGAPATLLGSPWREAVDLDLDGATLKNIGLYADLKRGYLIVDRMQITIETDPYTVNRCVKYTATKRVGGIVRQPEAIKLITTPDA